ncbi:MAG TPA: hypothetical protein VLX31_02825 [Streptosporangiaceae bacterium]|nr:hypothetical protein [Streptosporangiaceae bacterium]
MEGPSESGHAALRRVVGETGDAGLLELLSGELSGADLTTLLLEVYRRRACDLTPAGVLRRYGHDRFVRPGTVELAGLRRAEDAMLGALDGGFEVLALAPVLPLGSHFVMGGVDPRNVIATVRGSEVAADPTNGLALEAAARRRDLLAAAPRSAEPVRLAASQRVTRAQFVSGPVSFAHFQLLGLVTAGRDTGDHAFEREHLAAHLRSAARGLAALGAHQVRIAITCLDEPSERVFAAVRDELAAMPGVIVVSDQERQSGRGYYRGLCFKVYGPDSAGELLEVGDGGFTDWTARLLGSRKERLLISGYGIDRVAMLATGAA